MDLIIIIINVFIFIANIFVVHNASLKSLPIINGTLDIIEEAPFMVALKEKESKLFVCGGAIIAKRWIATAHHCIKDRTEQQIVAAVGSVIQSQGIEYDILEIISFPGHPNADFALLMTTSYIVFNSHVYKIRIAETQFATPTVARVYGWGQTENREEPNHLQYLDTTIQPVGCEHGPLAAKQNPYFMCTFASTTQKVCVGDSGGPLVHGNQLIGIVADYLIDCTTSTLWDVYSNVPYLLEWIQKTIFDHGDVVGYICIVEMDW